MNKCLVTKLSGSVHDSSLLRLGEMRIRLNNVENPTKNTQGLGLDVVKSVQLEIIGDGYFTDVTLTKNLGKTKIISSLEGIFVSNGAEIAVLDKYSLRQITGYYINGESTKVYNKNILVNISDLKYSAALTSLDLPGTQASGDIANLKSLTALTSLNLFGTQASGDIANLKSLTALTSLNLFGTQASGDIANLKSLTALVYLNLYNTQASGDIANLKSLTALKTLELFGTQASGDIANLKSLTALVYLNLYNTQASGDIANLKSLTALTSLNLNNTQVSGDIANLKSLAALKTLELYNTRTPITGNIGELSALTKLTEISCKYSRLNGDLAVLPASCHFASFKNDVGSVFTWSSRPSTAKIIAIEGNASITNIDKMLQDQAQCQVGFSSSDNLWYKTISAVGSRTSASDDAVAALQQKGYTISIATA